ncbi:MAG TPA: hypothetical protein VJU59_27600, partial [Paraburkholderia sp.]|uniref:hypothetical protein n=1 Tax=Paraburkholderia sp. TaxID=1926495 RepID=UPI002B466C28
AANASEGGLSFRGRRTAVRATQRADRPQNRITHTGSRAETQAHEPPVGRFAAAATAARQIGAALG